MVSALPAPDWPRRVIVVDDGSAWMTRGRNSEFLHHGVALETRSSALEALKALGHCESPATVLISDHPIGFPLDDFLTIVNAMGLHQAVVGADAELSAGIVWPHRERTQVVTNASIRLPASPERLAKALQGAAEPPTRFGPVYRVGALEVDVNRFHVRWQGESVLLAPSTFEVLERLMAAFPGVARLEDLNAEFAPPASGMRSLSVRSRIHRLRDQLEAAVPDIRQPIETVTKVGYRVAEVPRRRAVRIVDAAEWDTQFAASAR